MSEERAKYLSKLADLAESLNPNVELGIDERKEAFQRGLDVTDRPTEALLGELAFYRWLNGFSYVLRMHSIKDVALPDYQHRYGNVLAELQSRGVELAKDYTTRPSQNKPKATGGVEL